MFTTEKTELGSYIKFNGSKKQFTVYQKAIFAISSDHKFWDKERKQWRLTDSGLLSLKMLLGDDSPDLLLDPQIVQNTQGPVMTLSQKQTSEMGSTMKLQPFPYQKDVLAFMKENPELLIVSPCGSGKTPIMIGGFLETVYAKDKTAIGLIVVKASLKKQWLKEVSKFSSLKANILRTASDVEGNYWPKIKTRERNLAKPKFADKKEELGREIEEIRCQAQQEFEDQFKGYNLLICNYETLNDEIVRKYLKQANLKYMAADEIHYVKSAKAKRSQSLQEFSYIDHKYGATATPIMKDAEDIYGIYKVLKPNLFPKESKFTAKYIKYIMQYNRRKKVGSQNMLDLNREISPFMVVKTEEEVNKFLPEVFVMQREIEMDPEQVEMTESILSEIDELSDKVAQRKGQVAEAQIPYDPVVQELEGQIMARQTFAQELADSELLLINSDSNLAKKYLTGCEDHKVNAIVDLVEEIVESGEKVCIFSKYERMQPILTEAFKRNKILKKYKIAYVSGALSADRRYEEAYTKFQGDDNSYRTLMMSDAGAEGLNLSQCKYLIEVEPATSYAIQIQRHGRIKRADSVHKTTYVYQMICTGSFDEIGLKIIEKKRKYDASAIKGIITS